MTRQPEAPERPAVLINAVWGLGKYAVGGVVEPDHFLVAYEPPGAILEQTIPAKKVKLVWRPDGGEVEAPVPPEDAAAPCLTPAQLAQLAGWAARLEAHYGKPQDVEWALDEAGHLWLLQSRTLTVQARKPAAPKARVLKDHPVLLDKGAIACRGVGAGPVVLVKKDEDLKDCLEFNNTLFLKIFWIIYPVK